MPNPRRRIRDLDGPLYEQEREPIEVEECPELRINGTHSYGRDGTCRECSVPRGRPVRNGKE